MLSLSSTADVVDALRHATDIALTAYTLPPGSIRQALDAAAKRGAHVCVRLEGRVYEGAAGIAAENAATVDQLRADGVDAALLHGSDADGEPAVHTKSIIADGTVFLDDRNWPGDGADTIVADTFDADVCAVRDATTGVVPAYSPFFAATKRRALREEAALLASARFAENVIVETESFGSANPVYDALDACGRAGLHPRLLVCAREAAASEPERAAIAHLDRDGVEVRTTDAAEKFAACDGRGWIGSANATVAVDRPDQLDWGMRSDAADIFAPLRARFEARWAAGAPVTPPVAEPLHPQEA